MNDVKVETGRIRSVGVRMGGMGGASSGVELTNLECGEWRERRGEERLFGGEEECELQCTECLSLPGGLVGVWADGPVV